jgi:hypothetical protein
MEPVTQTLLAARKLQHDAVVLRVCGSQRQLISAAPLVSAPAERMSAWSARGELSERGLPLRVTDVTDRLSAAADPHVEVTPRRRTIMASTGQEGQPTQFELEGYGVRITYSTSSFAGPPQFSYRGPGVSSDEEVEATASGDDIRVEETQVGTLVTVVTQTIPDLGTSSVTILVPSFNMQGETEVPFETAAILAVAHTSIGGPQLVRGQLTSYRAVSLQGTATSAVF